MELNEHYQNAVRNEPAMVRGADLLVREILNRTTEATLAIALENRLSNLISLMSIPEFHEDKDAIEDEIRSIIKLKSNSDTDEEEISPVAATTLHDTTDTAPPESAYGVFEIKKPFI